MPGVTDPETRRFETLAVHAGFEPDGATGAVVPAIQQAVTFQQDAVGAPRSGYEYGRSGNPTRDALERAVAQLEGGAHGLAYASGLAASQNLLYLLQPGQRILLGDDVYGGTWRLAEKVWSRYGVAVDVADLRDLDVVAAALTEQTGMIWLESPTNPLLKVVDISAIARLAATAGALTVVDNTFATPYLQRPLELGADIVLHSTTKYLGGHSDLVGGFAATNDPTVAERIAFLQNSLGAVPGPFDSWLVLRGLKTLALRMQRHCENAHAIAAFLSRHPQVERVLYPGLPDHPAHDVAARQMSDFGGMVSFLAPSVDDAVALVARTKIWKLAESLGGVESLIEVPSAMTHASTADAPFASPPNLVRLSVGIESVDDLVADLDAALVRTPATA
jgi:cystathionine gamma-synthase